MSTTERAYYHLSGPKPYNAEIRELRSFQDQVAIILDKTIFYPEGGGQSSDRGTINGIPLLDVQEKNQEILHLVSAADAVGLHIGPAELVLDTVRRRDLTVHHTAQHLLSGTIFSITGKPTVSMHLGEEVCTIDVDTQGFSEETCIAVEAAVALAIEADHPVIIHHCPPEALEDFPLRKVPPPGEEVIRVVEIQGHDFSPCCGTHLSATGQIGMLRILGAEKYKGMTRLTFIAGRRVLQDSRLLRKQGELISRTLKVPVAETGKGVLALMEKTGKLEARVKALEEENARFKAEAVLRKAGLLTDTETTSGQGTILVETFPHNGMEALLPIGRAAQKLTAAVLLLAAPQDRKFAAFCSAPGFDIRGMFQKPMEAQGGRGGGSPSFFQGQFPTEEALAAFLESFAPPFQR
ncbi:MAG: alanyl-tRNA editing protein [Treponema sp.]|jgi:alanyl-tRNA synthetase|nr:alanyl-tRNA editing protein [Treponema sp.]